MLILTDHYKAKQVKIRNEIGLLNYRRPIKFEPKVLRIELEILKGTEAAKFIKQLMRFFCLVMLLHIRCPRLPLAIVCLV